MKIIKKYSNRKTLALQVLDGIVYVRAPYLTPDSIIESFIESKKSWLQKRIAMHQPLGYTGQEVLKILGQEYQVELSPSQRFSLHCNDTTNTLFISVPHDKSDEWLYEKVDNALKNHLNNHVLAYLIKYCAMLNIEVPPYKIRKYKRLYGRCSRTGELAFNTYLYHENPEFIEYVVVHELAHLYEFNHSKRFYAVVASMMPHYKEILNQKKQPKLGS